MRKYLLVVDRHRSTKWMRLISIIIDRIIFSIIFLILGLTAGIIDSIFNMYYFTKFLEKLSNLGKLADVLITNFLFFIYIFLIELFTKGKSIGKYITGGKVIMIDGTEPKIGDYFIRNIIRFVPFNAFSFLGQNGWHDSWSDTRVINYKNYITERQTKSEIENIGSKETE